jgi:AmmeMemoRadiSam system protein B
MNGTNGNASHNTNDQFPKLRPLDVRPLVHEGQPYILLRDPQQLSEHQLLVPQPLAAVLAFCDGRHDAAQMAAAFERQYGMELPEEAVDELLDALDAAVMLDNERAAVAHEAVRAEFRAAPYREAALAGPSYPAGEKALWRLLQDYLEEAGDIAPLAIDWSKPVGLLSPHIDYGRGGEVYAQVWKRAAQAAREAELVILFGTDHYGSDLFSLTRQNYATPYGVLPTATEIVDELAKVIGEEAAYAGELRHRGEHSLELVAVWLHHMRAGEPVPVVPILTGSFHPFMREGAEPQEDPVVRSVVATLRAAGKGKRVLVIASGDLAHVGPAFGGRPLTAAGREKLRAADDELIAAMQGGDVTRFFGAIRKGQNRNNVCGVAPIVLTMSLIGQQKGEQWGYATCPADENDTSVVTVTGMLFG